MVIQGNNTMGPWCSLASIGASGGAFLTEADAFSRKPRERTSKRKGFRESSRPEFNKPFFEKRFKPTSPHGDKKEAKAFQRKGFEQISAVPSHPFTINDSMV